MAASLNFAKLRLAQASADAFHRAGFVNEAGAIRDAPLARGLLEREEPTGQKKSWFPIAKRGSSAPSSWDSAVVLILPVRDVAMSTSWLDSERS